MKEKSKIKFSKAVINNQYQLRMKKELKLIKKCHLKLIQNQKKN
jgi:hypothetical protein